MGDEAGGDGDPRVKERGQGGRTGVQRGGGARLGGAGCVRDPGRRANPEAGGVRADLTAREEARRG